MSSANTIANAVTLLNALVAAAENADKYRSVVARAVAEGRDISDDELAVAKADLDIAIDAAARA